MAVAEDTPTRQLSLSEELLLMLLNEESGYFHQVPGWRLNCAVVGAALAELSLMSRIDTDVESLFLVDATGTGDSTLDPILTEIASERASTMPNIGSNGWRRAPIQLLTSRWIVWLKWRSWIITRADSGRLPGPRGRRKRSAAPQSEPRRSL